MILATSCSVDDDFSDLESSMTEKTEKSISPRSGGNADCQEILFNATFDGVSGTSQSRNTETVPTNFMITAYEGSYNYFDGQTDKFISTDQGNTWISDSRRYWPSSTPSGWDGLSFYAYTEGYGSDSAADCNSTYLDLSGTMPEIMNFKVDEESAPERYLLYSVAKTTVTPDADEKVNLDFNDALCQVGFSVRNDNPDYGKIEIESVGIGGLYSEGSYRFPTPAAPATGLVRIGNSRPKGVWTLSGGSEKSVYTLADLNVAAGTGTTSMPIPGKLHLIPQRSDARSSKTADSGTYLCLTVRITPKGAKQAAMPETVIIPQSINWTEGKRYVYDICWTSMFMVVTECESDID